jgi:glutamate/tyrosine decarboxylase-like PLP-dependent enzyme
MASSWVALKVIGQDGFVRIAKKVMETTNRIKAGVRSIPEMEVLGDPAMTALAIKAKVSFWSGACALVVCDPSLHFPSPAPFPPCRHRLHSLSLSLPLWRL